MPYTRSQARKEREKVLLKEKEQTVEAEKWKKKHLQELDIHLNDVSFFYTPPDSPIFIFLNLNKEIQESGNPWLLYEDRYSPESFVYEIFDRHLPCLNAWREWRKNVPRPESYPLKY